ncbi:MAG: general secretion pathway protein GspE [Planctomycetaceae bacterium]|nr:general secretion pathway protein GspE [Planctomycetaceae bacterium]
MTDPSTLNSEAETEAEKVVADLKSGNAIPTDARQKALQEELKELVEVVGPGPLVDLLLERSFQLRATDIHLDPNADGLRVRLRVDGLLHDVMQLQPDIQSQVISRVKLMANMDITERRMAQDGHISNAVLRHKRDIRVGSGPTIHGERLVLRLMPDEEQYQSMSELGMDDNQIQKVESQLRTPYGVILSAGPVGSGKSTTMYTCLEALNNPSRSLVTIEDPVERRLNGINQIQVDSKIDFTFVEALRGVLRQDPDVMMVGEIRDPETAHIALRAGLTGVSVLSTLHASDTSSVIDVFREFGIPPMFIADSLICVISQRLLRRVCPESNEMYTADAAAREFLGLDDSQEVQLRRGIPSPTNFNTGYTGRTGVFEIMCVDGELRRAILGGASHDELEELAVNKGMQRLEDHACEKVLAGETTVEEMMRVLTSFPADPK